MSDQAKVHNANRRWQVPVIAANAPDGWYEVPLWVMHGRAVPYPKERYTLADGTVAQPGDWIVADADGVLRVETP